MIRSLLQARLFTFSTVIFNVYLRNIKNYGIRKLKVSKLKTLQNCLNGSLLALVHVYCAEPVKSLPKEDKIRRERDVSVSINQSDEYFKVGNYEESYKILEVLNDVENPEVLWRMARSLYNMSKENNVKHGDMVDLIERAYAFIEKALKLDYQNYAVHKWMAILLDAKRNLEGTKARIEGLPEFKKHLMYAMELNPKDATTIYILGQYCYNIANMPWYQKKIASTLFATPPESTFEEALFYFTKAEEVEPNFYSLNLLMLGKTYLKLKKIEAARYWLKCASVYPIRTEEDKKVRKEAEELLKKYPAAKAAKKDGNQKNENQN